MNLCLSAKDAEPHALFVHGWQTSTGVHGVRVPDLSLRHQGRIYCSLSFIHDN